MACRSIKLLIVDDGTQFTERLVDQCETVLGEFEIQTRVVSSCDEAYSCVRSWAPEVIIFDVHTTMAHSFELISRWKETTFIIVTSDKHSEEVEKRVITAGASAYLVKPYEADDYERLINEIIVFVPLLPSAQ
jgi:DNA-binding response OmpR family regulator